MTRLTRIGAPLALALLTVPVLAQEKLQVVEVKVIDNAPVIWSLLLMGLLAAMAIGANAIPSKRGHQD